MQDVINKARLSLLKAATEQMGYVLYLLFPWCYLEKDNRLINWQMNSHWVHFFSPWWIKTFTSATILLIFLGWRKQKGLHLAFSRRWSTSLKATYEGCCHYDRSIRMTILCSSIYDGWIVLATILYSYSENWLLTMRVIRESIRQHSLSSLVAPSSSPNSTARLSVETLESGYS